MLASWFAARTRTEVVVLGRQSLFEKLFRTGRFLPHQVKLLLSCIALFGIGFDLLLQMRLLRTEQVESDLAG